MKTENKYALKDGTTFYDKGATFLWDEGEDGHKVEVVLVKDDGSVCPYFKRCSNGYRCCPNWSQLEIVLSPFSVPSQFTSGMVVEVIFEGDFTDPIKGVIINNTVNYHGDLWDTLDQDFIDENIVKVWAEPEDFCGKFSNRFEDLGELLFSLPPEIKKVTQEEVNEKFGCVVEVVSNGLREGLKWSIDNRDNLVVTDGELYVGFLYNNISSTSLTSGSSLEGFCGHSEEDIIERGIDKITDWKEV